VVVGKDESSFLGDDCIRLRAKTRSRVQRSVSWRINVGMELPSSFRLTCQMLCLTASKFLLQPARNVIGRDVTLRCIHSKSVVTATHNDKELADARRWLSNLNADTIPKNLCDISFSRSSGPGGQNVNK
jgi:hypothetical protein